MAESSPPRLMRAGKDRNLKLKLLPDAAADRENQPNGTIQIRVARSPRAALGDSVTPARPVGVERAMPARLGKVSPRATEAETAALQRRLTVKEDEVLVLQSRVRLLEERLRAKEHAVVGVLRTQEEAVLLLEEQNATRALFSQQRILELEADINALQAHVKELELRWVPDVLRSRCVGCADQFGLFVRKHHCR